MFVSAPFCGLPILAYPSRSVAINRFVVFLLRGQSCGQAASLQTTAVHGSTWLIKFEICNWNLDTSWIILTALDVGMTLQKHLKASLVTSHRVEACCILPNLWFWVPKTRSTSNGSVTLQAIYGICFSEMQVTLVFGTYGSFMIEYPIEMDDLGVPLFYFRKPSYYMYMYIYIIIYVLLHQSKILVSIWSCIPSRWQLQC